MTENATPDDGEELLLADVLEQFNRASASDVLHLGELEPAEVIATFLEAATRRQYLWRSSHPDGWTTCTLTTHGTVIVAQDGKGSITISVPSPRVGTGTLDLRKQILKAQADYRDNKPGWNMETGEQFGRWV